MATGKRSRAYFAVFQVLLSEFYKNLYGIAALYLFGSYARGEVRLSAREVCFASEVVLRTVKFLRK